MDLNADAKTALVAVTPNGRAGARIIKQANILFLANAGKVDIKMAELLHTRWLTGPPTTQIYEHGLKFALNDLPRGGLLPKIDDKIETI